MPGVTVLSVGWGLWLLQDHKQLRQMQNAVPFLSQFSASSIRQIGLVWVLLARGLLCPACAGVKPKTNSMAGGAVRHCNSTFVCLLTASTQNARVYLWASVSVAAELLTPGVCKTPGLWPL